MRHLALLALASLVLTGSVADAKKKRKKHRVDDESEEVVEAPRRNARSGKRAARVRTERAEIDVEVDSEAEEQPAEPARKRLGKRTRDQRERAERAAIEAAVEVDANDAAAEARPDDERVGAREDDEDLIDEVDVAPVKLRTKTLTTPKRREWNFAIGPYLWASSVEADVSLGSESVGAGVDFMDITRHARYGVPIQAEARYGRFSVAADFLYGVVDLAGNREVGPVMVSVDGTASSLLFDAAAGYLLAGGDHAVISVEARAGLRYQRTGISGSVGIDNSPVASPTKVDSAADGIGGARIAIRPFKRFAVTGAFDTQLFGASSQSWSGSGDASYQIGKRVLVSLGWRTLTTQRANLSLTMFGPRAAVQFLF